MENPNKKYISSDPIISKLEEPAIEYKLESENVSDNEMTQLLEKLIEKGLRESELGLGISNEEMKRRIKLRYPFLK